MNRIPKENVSKSTLIKETRFFPRSKESRKSQIDANHHLRFLKLMNLYMWFMWNVLAMSEIPIEWHSEIGWFAIYVRKCGANVHWPLSMCLHNGMIWWWNVRNISMYFITSFIYLNFGFWKWVEMLIKGDAFVIACKQVYFIWRK